MKYRILKALLLFFIAYTATIHLAAAFDALGEPDTVVKFAKFMWYFIGSFVTLGLTITGFIKIFDN